MPPELIAAPLLAAAAGTLFHRFKEGTRPRKRAAKWAVSLGVSGLSTLAVGRPWSLVWTFGCAPGRAGQGSPSMTTHRKGHSP